MSNFDCYLAAIGAGDIEPRRGGEHVGETGVVEDFESGHVARHQGTPAHIHGACAAHVHGHGHIWVCGMLRLRLCAIVRACVWLSTCLRIACIVERRA